MISHECRGKLETSFRFTCFLFRLKRDLPYKIEERNRWAEIDLRIFNKNEFIQMVVDRGGENWEEQEEL